MTTALLERPETTTVRFEPRGGAKELWSNRDALALFEGPAGTGKSLAALWKLHMAALSVKLRGLIVRQTHLSLTSTTLTLFEEQVIRQALDTGLVKWFGSSSRQPTACRYANGSQILVGGLDQPTKLLSSEYDRVIVDEANETTENSIETIVTRLRGSAPTYKQAILLSNPDAPSHWLKQRQSNGGLPSIKSRHKDNPAYSRPPTTPVRSYRLVDSRSPIRSLSRPSSFEPVVNSARLKVESAFTRSSTKRSCWAWSVVPRSCVRSIGTSWS